MANCLCFPKFQIPSCSSVISRSLTKSILFSWRAAAHEATLQSNKQWMVGSDQIILIKLDRISAGQQMLDDAACLCLLLWCKEEVMDQLNCNQDRLYQSLEAKMMKRDIFACWRDYRIIVTCNNGASGSELSWGFAWQNFPYVKFLKVILDGWSNIISLKRKHFCSDIRPSYQWSEYSTLSL